MFDVGAFVVKAMLWRPQGHHPNQILIRYLRLSPARTPAAPDSLGTNILLDVLSG
jgi:hypothetical protein